MNKIESIKKTKYKKFKDENNKKFNTEVISINSENDINKLIPNIKKLSTKFMINQSVKNNMTQSDFIFFDNFFVTRGKQQYSKESFEMDI